ncbi:putative nucleic acid-binding protein [Allocatelliglobosispora scoriae]|uniref:Putative nucleic acid-binding protein n=1 Tax=Allocatelliglobosispora scoriae TaxID=643052 RepID=A0A841BIH1_9ACTN|nr:hypothetical protein [Allocatelliglobosispora scoriae]MBB5866986.1 putative nucleic acid-binding protein [Allocatelliglobosispora scoriae]
MTIRLVLDTSALTAYLADDLRAMEIAELLVTVAEDDGITAFPALCVIEAYRTATPEQRRRLSDLAADDDGHTVMLPVLAADVPAVAELRLGLTLDRAQAAAEALKHGVVLGTYDPRGYAASTFPADSILEL